MMMEKKQISFPRYEHYKDSGIDWIGEIPAHWEIKKLKYLAEINPIHKPRAEFQDQKVIFLPMEKVSEIGKKDYSEFKVYQEVINGYTSFQRYDVLLAKITPCFENGKSAYLDDMPTEYGFGSTEFHVIRAKTATEKYLFYLVTSGYFRKDAEAFMVGSAGQKRVTTEYLKNHKFFIPPPSEQTAIAQFLDHKTAQIDRAIAIKEAQIKLLNERKQIMIQEAVTKGLDPSVPMKDSGIEWLGEIPEHWAVKRLGSLFSERREIVSDVDYPPLSVTMKGIVPQLDTAAKSQDSNNRKLVCVGDFVINSRSDRKGSSGISLLQGSVSLINTVLRPKGIYSSYTNYLLKSYVFIEEYYRIGRGIVADLWTTRYNEMKNIMIAIPPLAEQTAIAQFLDHKTVQIDGGIEKIKSQIQTLKEYKTTLINEAVTGKIKIH